MNMFSGWFKQKSEIPNSKPGLYHYLIEQPGEKARVHLRLDVDGTGTLIVNANRIMHLNPTAALMAKLTLDGKPDDDIRKEIKSRWKVDHQTLKSDLATFHVQLANLLRPDGACPVHELNLETVPPFSVRPSAPYRLDLALTYRCNNDCAHCYNLEHPVLSAEEGSGMRAKGELDTDRWKQVIQKAWSLGIPHIVFTGGEPTLREDLPELIAYAEANGQITGLNTNGRRLSDPRYVEKLVQAGLDHVQITLESCEPEIHNQMVRAAAFDQTLRGLQNALQTRLFVMTNTTMLTTNAHTIPATLDFLADLGVPTVGLNALIYAGKGAAVGTGLPEAELKPLLEIARQKTAAHGQKLIWYTPTQYCRFDPVQMELGVKGCTAAQYNLCIEPNGDVLPCQSYYRPLGNWLRDTWDALWNHPLAVTLRERQNLPIKCEGCALLAECGGGCPLQFAPLFPKNVAQPAP
ncbi:MAG: radical SAM protein [Anaerolineales bacterium]|nr:radical SAM protein [Anaerolineales bacterium]MCX7755877.1 radical SAM protein [Anaerolineales bacterium]MDW8277959.1 radical SAM protein [Anaerolineales bacterium]